MNHDSGSAVARWRMVVGELGADHQRRAVAQSELGAALLRRYREEQSREDLVEAVAVLEMSVRAMADTPLARDLDSVDGAQAVLVFCDALLDSARAGGGIRELQVAEQWLQLAEDVSTDMTRAALLMLKTCQVYQCRHEFDGSVDTLYQGIAHAKMAERWVSEQHRAVLHGVHAEALLTAYNLTGVEDYLDEAIQLLSSVTTTGRNQDGLVAALAKCLLAKATGTTHTADLERAVALLQQHAPRTNGPRFLAGQVSIRLFERTGRAELLEQAWQSFLDVLSSTPERHRDHRAALANLSTVATKAHQLTGQLEQLEAAVGLNRRALALSDRADPDHAPYADGLGYSLRQLYDATQEPAYLEEATALYRLADESFNPRDPRRVAVGLSLAQALRATYVRSGDPDRLTEAAQRALTAGRIETGPVPGRIQAFDKAGHSLAGLGRWADATDAFEEAIALLPRVASRGRTRHDQYADLSSTVGLAAVAASCAVNAGQAERALELLERGRGVLLNQRLTPGGELAVLQRTDEALAADFLRLRRDFEAPPPDVPRPAVFNRDRETEWNVLLDTIRAVPGLADFLRPVGARQLLDQLTETVVVPFVSEYRSAALIVRDGRTEPVPLPDLSITDMTANLTLLQDATAAAHDPTVDARTRMRAQSTLLDVLDWTWRSLVKPVLDELGAQGTDERLPHVWWCPVGPLAFFPLHAAQSRRGDSALDRLVSSYTPTVTALARVRARPRASGPAARSCVVAMRSTPGLPGALRAAAREGEMAAQALPAAWTATDEHATRHQVLERLAVSTYAHFACHAVSDPLDPAQGKLLVHDHQETPLTVADVSGLDLDAELGFLSACATSKVPLHLADESLHITAAFQLAGFRQVIGTLWEIDDEISLELATTFYERNDPAGDAAYALHSAVGNLRARYSRTPSLWAAHVHSGG